MTSYQRSGRISRLLLARAAMVAITTVFVGTDALATEYSISAVPAWVTPVQADVGAQTPEGEVRQGVHHLLVDQQTRLDGQSKLQFRHYAKRAVNERGAESVAHVEISFDPSYQALVLHSVDVIRAGIRRPRLRNAAVKVLQRESELEARIYDGSKTANIFLDDVRPGDVVEVAYTLRGNNPVFEHREFGQIDLQWNVPLAHLYRSLSLPAGQPLKLASHLTELKAQTTVSRDEQTLVWQAHAIPALIKESETPNWFDPYPSISWSQFRDWAEVARWAEPLYKLPTSLSAQLKAEVDRIAAQSPDPETRLLAALRFVQGEIRYLGIEIGPGSHAPRDPALVLQRRYGDCKDKSLLTITLLKALGITAHAALVDTQWRKSANTQLPSPGVFNHVIVQVQLAGKTLWLDPTREPQQGTLAKLTQADYGSALVLDGQSNSLTDMPVATGEQHKRHILQRFDAQNGFDQPVPLTITTVYEGLGSDRMRDTLRNEDRATLQRDYQNFYARQYPGLTVRAPMAVKDDEAANHVELTESYLIPVFWEDSKERKRLEGVLRAPDLRSLLRDPQETIRKTPLSLKYPDVLDLTIEAQLPEDWKISRAAEEITHPAFKLRFNKELNGRTVVLHYHYESLKDHVPPADVAGFVAQLSRARALVGLTLHHPNRTEKTQSSSAKLISVAWPTLLVLTLIAIAWAHGGGLGWSHPVPSPSGNLALSRMSARRLVWAGRFALALPPTGMTLSVFTMVHSLGWTLPNCAIAASIAGYLLQRLLSPLTLRRWYELALQRCQDDPAELERLARRHRLWPLAA